MTSTEATCGYRQLAQLRARRLRRLAAHGARGLHSAFLANIRNIDERRREQDGLGGKLPLSGKILPKCMLATGQMEHYIPRHHWHDAIGRQWLRDATALPPVRQESAMTQSPNLLLNSL